MPDIPTRRVLPTNHAEVRAQLAKIGTRVAADGLGSGDDGAAVLALQKRLRAFGVLDRPADGDFGPETEAAVRALQRAAGLVVDGVAGPQTHAAMQDLAAHAPDARAPDAARCELAPGDGRRA